MPLAEPLHFHAIEFADVNLAERRLELLHADLASSYF
jgi:hypothetical protein